MKKVSFLPILALALAVAASAFKLPLLQKDRPQTQLYWFRYDDAQNKFVFDRHAEEPTISCDGLGSECAQGFAQPNSSGEQVYPGINLVDEREKNE